MTGIITRRNFLRSALAGPAIVAASSIMPIRALAALGHPLLIGVDFGLTPASLAYLYDVHGWVYVVKRGLDRRLTLVARWPLLEQPELMRGNAQDEPDGERQRERQA